MDERRVAFGAGAGEGGGVLVQNGDEVQIGRLNPLPKSWKGGVATATGNISGDLTQEIVDPLVELARTHTSPSIERSVLMRMGIDTPTAGKVLIDGVECIGPHDDAVMVFQRYANRPDLTVFDNVAFPFRLNLWKARVPEAEWRQRVADILKAVGLADKLKLRPAQLSGGQNQRVALARALVLRPRILLMDEPFGALDAQTREEMQQLLIELYQSWPCLVVFVTHDVTEALVLGDRVIVLSAQPARVADDFVISEARPRSAT